MAVDEDLAERVRAVLAGNGQLREVRMFGGLCFMLNGNMVGGTSKRGVLVRVGKEGHARALARPDARPMEMSGRLMEGYVALYPHRRHITAKVRAFIDMLVERFASGQRRFDPTCDR